MSVASIYLALSMMDPVIGADIYVYLKMVNVNILLIYIINIYVKVIQCTLHSTECDAHYIFIVY